MLGIPLKIVTNCSTFKITMKNMSTETAKNKSTKIARWACMLSDFDYITEHRRDTSMSHVDALSRNQICMVTQSSVTLKIIQTQEGMSI